MAAKKELNTPQIVSDARQVALDTLKKNLNKKFGDGTLSKAGEIMDLHDNYTSYSTGSLSLDAALGTNGAPSKRVIEIAGPEHAGKTSLALCIAASAQRAGKVPVYIDNEHGLDPKWAETLGVDWNNLFRAQFDNIDDCFQAMSAMIQSDAVDVIILDSLTSLPMKRSTEEKGSDTAGIELASTEHLQRANLITKFFQNNLNFLDKHDVSLVIINQVREKIGGMKSMGGGPTYYTPGGMGAKHAASQRVFLKPKLDYALGVIKGIGATYEIKKNRMARPYTKGEIWYTKDGIEQKDDLFILAANYGLYQKPETGSTYKPSAELIEVLGLEEDKYVGVDKFKSSLFSTKESIEKFKTLVKGKMERGVAVEILEEAVAQSLVVEDYDEE